MLQAALIQAGSLDDLSPIDATSATTIVHCYPRHALLAPLQSAKGHGMAGKQVLLASAGTGSIAPMSSVLNSWLQAQPISRQADRWHCGPWQPDANTPVEAIGTSAPTDRSALKPDVPRKVPGVLAPEELWLCSGADNTVATIRSKNYAPCAALSTAMRSNTMRGLKLTTVRQMGSLDLPLPYTAPQTGAHALYAKLCDTENLLSAWMRVKQAKKTSHGIDQVSIEQFGQRLDDELLQLSEELTHGRYQCRPMRVIRIPKPDGGERMIRLACVRDRVVQAALLGALEPAFEPKFHNRSFAYRSGRSALHAIAVTRSLINQGRRWLVCADIEKCFDSIDHDILMRLVSDEVSDHAVLALVRQFLRADVLDFADFGPMDRGIAQGDSVSPLLANVYLNSLDHALELQQISFVRYADDFLLFCVSESAAKAALDALRRHLTQTLALSIKASKTLIAHADDGLEFLGFFLRTDGLWIPDSRVSRTLEALKTRLVQATDPALLDMQRLPLLERCNALVRGFRNYYGQDLSAPIADQLKQMDVQADVVWQSAAVADAGNAWRTLRPERFFVVSSSPDAGPLPDAARYPKLHGEPPRQPDPMAPREANLAAPRLASPADAEGVFAIGRQLHVHGFGCHIRAADSDVVVIRRKKEIARHAIADLDTVLIEGDHVALSSGLSLALARHNVSLLLLPFGGSPQAAVYMGSGTRAQLRMEQALRANDSAMRAIGAGFLAAKLGNQAALLRYFAKYRKRSDVALHDALAAISDGIRATANAIEAVDHQDVQWRARTMGLEGKAAAAYWQGVRRLLPAHVTFERRTTQGAQDAYNMATNYVYALLYAQVWRAVAGVGLDPYFGIVHRTERDQGSLIFDVIEQFRAPFGDRVVLSLLGRGLALQLDTDGMLAVKVRKKLAGAFETLWQKPIVVQGQRTCGDRLLMVMAKNLARAFQGSSDCPPFRFKW